VNVCSSKSAAGPVSEASKQFFPHFGLEQYIKLAEETLHMNPLLNLEILNKEHAH
jgi:hypothetical protein